MTTMKTIAEYIWIDHSGNLRSKARTLKDSFNYKSDPKKLPEWNFDGSSTNQATTDNSEVIIKPVAIYKDPFRTKTFTFSYDLSCILVLCDCYDRLNNPLESNFRFKAQTIFGNKLVQDSKIWYGVEQEYVLIDNKTKRLLGWGLEGEPEPQGKYYCGVGADRSFGRELVEEHFLACIEAGLNISGINEEVLPGQWEFQIGPCEGISCADQVFIGRYLLHRICEKYGVVVSFEPKPVDGNWNCSGQHCNFSTKEMREGDIPNIMDAIQKLSLKHKEHMEVYGDNSKRLTGTHETSSIDKFTYGFADRSASIRIPTCAETGENFYCEDRRPASNADVYLVTSIIAKTILL